MSNPLTNNNNQPEEVIVEVPAEKKEFVIGSSKYTLTELVKELKLEDLEDQQKFEVISMHIRKGSVQALNRQTKQEKVLQNVTKGLMQLSRIKQLEAEQQQAVIAQRNKKNTERLKYEDVKFTVTHRIQMEKVRQYLQSKAIPATVIQDVDTAEFVFTIKEATDAELNLLDKYLMAQEIAIKSREIGGKILSGTSTILQGALALTSGVVAGTTKVSIDVVGKTAEAITTIGAIGVVSSKDAFVEAAKNLSNNKEAIQAKELLSHGWDAMKRKFGSKKGNRFTK